jgi:muramoyltetrapeptide carboxypeptidase
MEKPPYLKNGDKVAIVSTARKMEESEIKSAIDVLRSWNLEPVFGDYLFNSFHQFSGTTEQRTSDLQNAMDDESIKAIICARGGYGTVKLVDSLDFSEFKRNPKWIVGYSDVTVLHNHINQNFNIQTLHATMPLNFESNTAESLESLRSALFHGDLDYSWNSHELNRVGSANGKLVGGNLSIIYSLTGTNSQIDTKGRVLFLEDLDEYLYHVDRMMMNLKRAGLLDGLAGLVIGGMSDMNDNTIPYGGSAEEIIAEAVREYDFPVCFDFPAGHLDDNRTLIMGGEVHLEVSDNCRLNFINS